MKMLTQFHSKLFVFEVYDIIAFKLKVRPSSVKFVSARHLPYMLFAAEVEPSFQSGHLKGALVGKAPPCFANIRLGCKLFAVTNALLYITVGLLPNSKSFLYRLQMSMF
jgi:hypothetical protein